MPTSLTELISKDSTPCHERSCTTDPCQAQTCPAHPYAQCRASPCTQCVVQWYWRGELVDCTGRKGHLIEGSRLATELCTCAYMAMADDYEDGDDCNCFAWTGVAI